MIETSFDERRLPANIEAEKAILGGIILENSTYFESPDLGAHDFVLDSHRRIFTRLGELLTSGSPVDLVTLTEEFYKRKEVGTVGGAAYLSSLIEGVPKLPSLLRYVAIVKEKAQLRELINICTTTVTRAFDQSEETSELVADADRQILEISRSSEKDLSIAEQTDAAFGELENQRERSAEPGISSGVPSLDGIIGGYKRKKLYVIGGRPSMGKTSLMVEAAIQHCARRIRTRLVSLEMTSEELLHRIFAVISGVPYGRLLDPTTLNDDEWKSVRTAREMVKTWPLEIDERDGQTIDYALAGCRTSCRRRGTGFVALDYIQNLRFVGPGKLRYQEISDAAKKCRQFAKEENVSFMLLSSITESQDKNPNRRPFLSDLRGSGDLAFHADAAILVHRERDGDGASIKTESELIVAKQRGGRTGLAKAHYSEDSLMFE